MKKLTLSILLCLAFALTLSAQSPSSISSEEVATITTVRETWRIQADISPTDATLEILRRETRSVADVVIGTKPAPTIRRALSTAASDTVTMADDTQLTFAQVFEAVARFTAKWEAEDTPPIIVGNAEDDDAADPE